MWAPWKRVVIRAITISRPCSGVVANLGCEIPRSRKRGKRPLLLLVTSIFLLASAVTRVFAQPINSSDFIVARTGALSDGNILVVTPAGTIKQYLFNAPSSSMAADPRSQTIYSIAGYGFVRVPLQGQVTHFLRMQLADIAIAGGRLYVAEQCDPCVGQLIIHEVTTEGVIVKTVQAPYGSFTANRIEVNGCTLFYGDGPRVRRYDLCNQTALADVASLGDTVREIRRLPDDTLLVAATSSVVLLASDGTVIRTYVAAVDEFRSVTLPYGGAFYAGGNMIVRFSTAGAAIETLTLWPWSRIWDIVSAAELNVSPATPVPMVGTIGLMVLAALLAVVGCVFYR